VGTAFGRLDENLLNLIKILTERRSVQLFGKIAEEYYRLYDESRGILRVEAITALPLTKAQADAITRKLSSSLNKTVVLSNTIDQSTLGGVKLRYGGVQLDGTVKTRLDKFEEALKNTVI
jgi:F-type H+-transporting ATPase subunit delta